MGDQVELARYCDQVHGRSIKKGPSVRMARLVVVFQTCSHHRSRPIYHSAHFTNTMEPKTPARLFFGPAVKNSSFLPPLAGVPPPKAIPHS